MTGYDSYKELRDHLTTLGFDCVQTKNDDDYKIEYWTNFNSKSAFTLTIEFYYDIVEDPYIQFCYTPKCLGSTLKSMPLYSRNIDLNRFDHELNQFNDMVTQLFVAGY